MNLPTPDTQKYNSAKPFPHLVIDKALPKWYLKHVVASWPELPLYPDNSGQKLKAGTTDESVMGVYISSFIKTYFHSQQFIFFLEELTGIKGLVLDCREIGLHETFPGGTLLPHIDYTINQVTGLQHRVNAIVYLNDENIGGELELGLKNPVKIEPVFNRMVIFNVKDAWHGHPNPVTTGSRKSIALNYFTTPEKDAKHIHTTFRKKTLLNRLIHL